MILVISKHIVMFFDFHCRPIYGTAMKIKIIIGFSLMALNNLAKALI